MRSRAIDITSLRRLKGLLNLIRDAGLVLTSLVLLLSLAYWPLLILVALLGWASIRVWRGSPVAAAIQAVLALSGSVLFLYDYVTRPATIAAQGFEPEEAELLIAFSKKMNLGGAILLLAFFALFLSGLGAALVLRKALRPAADPRGPLVRLQRQLARLRSRRTVRAALWYSLSVSFGLLAMALPLVGTLPWVFGLRAMPPQYSLLEGPTWLFLAGLAWILIFVALTLKAATKAKRLATLSVTEARSLDSRPPVLLLRSFRDDMTPLWRTTDSRAWMRSIIHRHYFTLEEAAEDTLSSFGPVIAIGRPGETLPPAGAAREYVSNEAWRGRIKEHIAEARLIVVILGDGEGLQFEYRALRELDVLSRVFILFPPVSEVALNDRWNRFATCALGESSPSSLDRSCRTLLAMIGSDGMTLVTCRSPDDEDTYRIALQRSLAILSSEEGRTVSRSS